ncbi:hypothetical protein CQW23_25977 [Capsicum baccatum]|uniref:Protein kinase domain-containing protein n=1 Tax=Capsicum baccatum TaxID=33114 RepID=A0A2G2VMI5_CAPBA|nr:hypothetical protein CQW23_25977 [Capsicum baccatum]
METDKKYHLIVPLVSSFSTHILKAPFQQIFFYLPALKPNCQDFGLSKIISIGHSYASLEVRGSFGYVDPEYQKNRHVNSYGDVYNFGIVLLQSLSGQRVINLDLKNPMPLSKMAKNLTKGGNIKEFADPKLEGKFSMVEFELVFKIALSSIGLKQQRPSMEQVVIKLEEALDLATRIESVHSLYLVSPD